MKNLKNFMMALSCAGMMIYCTRAGAEEHALRLQKPATQISATTRNTTLPDEIRKVLEANGNGLLPITVRWHMSKSSPLKPEQAARELKLDPFMAQYFTTGGEEQWATRQPGRYREWRKEDDRRDPKLNQISQTEAGISFDGVNNYMSNHVDMGGQKPSCTLLIQKLADMNGNLDARYFNGGYFNVIGIDPSLRIRDMVGLFPPVSEVLRRMQHGSVLVGIEEQKGPDGRIVRLTLVGENLDRTAAMAVDLKVAEEELTHTANSPDANRWAIEAVKLKRTLPERIVDVFDLDPELNYAMRRHEVRYENGIIAGRTVCEDLRQVDDRKLWLPWKVRNEEFTSMNVPTTFYEQPVQVQEYVVSDVKVETKPDEFYRLGDERPGTTVTDRTGTEEKVWQVEEDGTHVDPRQSHRRSPTTQHQ